jgi:phosphate transport system substrate-binding protein
LERRITVALAILSGVMALGVRSAHPQEEPIRDALRVQEARNKRVAERGKKAWYTKQWDLSGLPKYVPQQKVTGVLRIWGNNYLADGMLGAFWEQGFKKYHPASTIEYHLPTSAAGVAAVTTGAADLGMTRKVTFLELLAFQREHKSDPLEITAARGSFDVPGWTFAFAIFVNKANPIERITIEQLDGIFGVARTGGWMGTEWHPEFARGADKNIRRWGQLGLTGEWANQPINVYAVSMRYNSATLFSDLVLRGSDQYNENLRCYANYRRPDGSLAVWHEQMREDLGKDPYGINFSGFHALTPQTKTLAVQAREGGPYVAGSLESVRDRTYPLGLDMYFYLKRDLGTALDPKIKEFLRYVLSQEGQQEVQRDGKYLPLTAEVVREQLKKLE